MREARQGRSISSSRTGQCLQGPTHSPNPTHLQLLLLLCSPVLPVGVALPREIGPRNSQGNPARAGEAFHRPSGRNLPPAWRPRGWGQAGAGTRSPRGLCGA